MGLCNILIENGAGKKGSYRKTSDFLIGAEEKGHF